MKYFFIILILILPISAEAATVFISPESDGVQSIVSISIDTDGVPVNTVSMILNYDENNSVFSGYDSSSSPIQFWVSRPHALAPGKIELSGIIPGGAEMTYDPLSDKDRLHIVKLLFRGNADVSVDESTILVHDGKGTQLEHDIVVEEKVDLIHSDSDSNMPEAFQIQYLPSFIFSRTPSLLVFNSEDSKSGIAYYEIRIGKGNWQRVESPVAVRKYPFARTATVRAYDNSGNITESSIRISGDKNVAAILSALAIFAIITIGVMIIRKRKS